MIGFDIGGTKCAVSIGEFSDGKIKIEDKKIIQTNHNLPPLAVIDKLTELAKSMTDKPDIVGISCGSPLDSKQGIILSPPNLPGWDRVEICKYLREKYGLRAYLQNDANACALAEWLFGAGKGCKNMIFLTFGSGLGAGLILNGRLYTGTNDMAGEVGHIRLAENGPVGYGKRGSFEGFCSGNGIAELGRIYAVEKLQEGKTVSYCGSYGELKNVTAKLIAEKAKEGFADAAEVYAESGRRLGQGLSVLIDILNPERIVIGSVFERSGGLLEGEMNKIIEKEALSFSRKKCEIVPAALGDSIGDYAAFCVAEYMSKNTERTGGYE